MSSTSPRLEPIHSTASDDAEFRPLVEMYLAELSGTTARLSAAIDANDKAMVQKIAHQLRGSGASYGYQLITERAGLCDEAIRLSQPWLDHAQELRSILMRCVL